MVNTSFNSHHPDDPCFCPDPLYRLHYQNEGYLGPSSSPLVSSLFFFFLLFLRASCRYSS